MSDYRPSVPFILMHPYIPKIEMWAARLQGKGLWKISHEKEAASLKELMTRHGLPDPRIIFDGGANVGKWTQAALKSFPDARYFLFEPSRQNIETLKARFPGEPFRVLPLALSNSKGTATLYSNEEGSVLGSLYARELRHIKIDFPPMYEIATTTIDEFVRAEQLDHIDVLKLDVEGHELAVLQGASESLDRIGAIHFEFGGCNIDSRTYFRDFWLLLNPRFHIYRLAKYEMQLITAYSEREEYFVTSTFFAIKK